MHLEVVAGMILRDTGEVLCVKRGASKFASTAWKWEFPGGKIEPGETPEQALVRELKEELDMEVTPLALAHIVDHTYPEFSIRLHGFLCTAKEAEPTLKEHVAYQWVKADDLGQLDFAAADTPLLDALRERTYGTHLRTRVIGQDIRFIGATTSTNDDLLQLAESGAPEGTLIVAETQTKGRGRLGRTWLDTPGCALLFSLLVRPQVSPEILVTIPLLCGVSMALAIEKVTGITTGLKWPNDLLIGEHKVCGILCEAQTSAKGIEGIIIGIGVNTSLVPESVAYRATSIGERVDRIQLLATFCNIFESLYAQWQETGLTALRAELDRLDCKINTPITIRQNELLSGISRGIAEDGALLLEQADGTLLPITCGEILQWAD